MEIQTTPKITNIMLFIGIASTWFAVAFLSEPFLGHSAAPTWAAFTFFGFAFHAPRQAALMSFGFGLPMLGISYYRYIRHDTLGLVVAITAVAIAGMIGLAYRRSRLQKG